MKDSDTVSNGENYLPVKLGQVTECGGAAIAQSI
jgi:hypothetical protein